MMGFFQCAEPTKPGFIVVGMAGTGDTFRLSRIYLLVKPPRFPRDALPGSADGRSTRPCSAPNTSDDAVAGVSSRDDNPPLSIDRLILGVLQISRGRMIACR
jgi:hypothetical protein